MAHPTGLLGWWFSWVIAVPLIWSVQPSWVERFRSTLWTMMTGACDGLDLHFTPTLLE